MADQGGVGAATALYRAAKWGKGVNGRWTGRLVFGLQLLAVGTAMAAPEAKPEKPVVARADTAAPAPAAFPGAAVIPSPYQPDAEEQEHLARYDKAIAAVRATPVSDADAAALREAVKAYQSAKPDAGDAARATLSEPVARKLAAWVRLRSGYGTPSEYRAFLDANPAWPDRRILTQRMEEQIFKSGGTAAEIRAAFANSGPDTGAGFAALASSYFADGRLDEAKKYAAKAWRDMSMPASLEAGFLSRFAGLLTLADHKARLDRLIIDDVRYKAQRNERAAVVKRLLPLLPEDERKVAEARLQVFLQSAGGRQAIEALPATKDTNWGLVFHKIQSLRRANQIEKSAKLMLSVPTSGVEIENHDEWWIERRANAYAALRIGNPKLAYELVRDAGELSVNPRKDQAFMAGWLALRYLRDASAAEPHFKALKAAADGPLSRAKANYWLGRLAEAKKDGAAASQHYAEATLDRDTFHGLLAAQKLTPGTQRFEITPPAAPTQQDIQTFNSRDAVKAAVIAHKAKLDRTLQRVFLGQIRFALETEAESAMLAHLAEALGDTQMAVRTAKSAIADRQNLITYGYPVHPFPAYSPLRKPPETAFLLGIARQETEFNTQTVSGAGAKGLLQVMTITAQHVCRDYKIKCDIKKLLADSAYNTMMASAYIGDRMDDFSGSYILTLAGYNAGPGRAREWIREFGDPRDPKVDPIDWIERIPIQETREYVAKVLANVQVYRARLGEQSSAVRLEKDLMRARLANRGDPGAPDDPSRKATASDG